LYQQLLQLDPSPPAPRAAALPAAAPAAPQPAERRLAEFLLQPDSPPPAPAVRSIAPPAAGIPRAAAAPAPAPAGPFASSGSEISQLLKWFSAFKEYRRQRIMAWSKFIGTTGPQFVMPAIIDFGYSLRGVNYTEVPVPQQVQLMGELARRQDAGLLVHGYVPFNPIRFVKDQADATGAIFDAVDNQGFIGIKLYPPMGFQASGNDKISMHFFDIGEDRNTLGKRIDGALNWIYDYCLKHDVTIMAHTAPSNTPHGNPYDGLGGGRDDWSRRPDPKYWDAVLSAGRQNLRVLFAHFGGAYTVSKNRAWVDSIVGLMMKYPNVYGDFSYYDLVLDNTQDQRAERRELRNYLQTLDAAKRQKLQQRLVFGSDWEMLDLVVDTQHYTRNMLGFLAESLGGRAEDYAACNALRMIGLDDPNSKTSQRLLRFHQRTANRATLMTFMQLAGPQRVAAARSATR
jgi:predicted TIM-barrel fold metal-dependent hydrolase